MGGPTGRDPHQTTDELDHQPLSEFNLVEGAEISFLAISNEDGTAVNDRRSRRVVYVPNVQRTFGCIAHIHVSRDSCVDVSRDRQRNRVNHINIQSTRWACRATDD